MKWDSEINPCAKISGKSCTGPVPFLAHCTENGTIIAHGLILPLKKLDLHQNSRFCDEKTGKTRFLYDNRGEHAFYTKCLSPADLWKREFTFLVKIFLWVETWLGNVARLFGSFLLKTVFWPILVKSDYSGKKRLTVSLRSNVGSFNFTD